VATTVNVAVAPTATVWLAGCVVIATEFGAALEPLVELPPQPANATAITATTKENSDRRVDLEIKPDARAHVSAWNWVNIRLLGRFDEIGSELGGTIPQFWFRNGNDLAQREKA
jgi:hypothetical protein